VFDITHTSKITYVVMEYIEGETLARIVKHSGALAPRGVLEIGIDVSEGLRAGLDQGLIHRDVKPANIMVSKAGGAKIVDLGLAVSSRKDVEGSLGHSAIGSLVGTHGYMAPEAIAREAVDFRADIYSLGVTLYYAAAGRLPIPNDDAERCMRLHREGAIPRPETLRNDLPPALSELLMWMLARRASDRPSSYDDLSREMRRILDQMNSETGSQRQP
jgi:serine/threonine-protein kinase